MEITFLKNMSQQPKKIIFAANASWYLWNFRRNLMYALKKDGHEIMVLSSRDEYTDRIANEFSYLETKFLNRSGMNPLRDALLFFEYLFLYRKHKPDMVLNFTIKPNIYSSLACWLLHIPSISTITGLGYVFEKKGFIQWISIFLYKISISHNRFVVFQNYEHQELFIAKKIVAERNTVIIAGSGIDTERFFPASFPVRNHGTVSFVMIARLLRDKGMYEFIEASKIIKKKYPDTVITVVGGLDAKNPSSVSQQELDMWTSEGAVTFVGNVEDVRPYLVASDVAVLPSYHEGLSKSLIEAMAMQRPIIATDIPGCRPLIDQGVNGLLIPVKNVTALMSAMEKCIIMSREQLAQMGRMGRNKVLEVFDEKIIIEAYKKLIT